MQRHPSRETALCWIAGLGLLVGAAASGQSTPPALSAPQPGSAAATGSGSNTAAAGSNTASAAAGQAAAADKAPAKVIRTQKVVVMDDGAAERPGDRQLEYRVVTKSVARGYLGIGLTDLTPELRSHFGVPQDAGVMVSKVDAGSPAEKAGLKVGDILTGFDGKPVATSFDIRQRIRAGEDGAAAPLEVWRSGKVQTLTANLEKRDRPEIDLAPLFLRKKDGSSMILSLDGEELPDKLAYPITAPSVPGHPRVQTLTSREAELEKRLKQLETRIHDLERQLGAAAVPAAPAAPTPKH